MTGTFEINGKTYERIVKEPQQNKSRGGSKMKGMLLPYIMAMGAMNGGNQSQKAPKELDVDIVEEFALIQEKKSKLSKSERDWVEKTFRKNFKEI